MKTSKVSLKDAVRHKTGRFDWRHPIQSKKRKRDAEGEAWEETMLQLLETDEQLGSAYSRLDSLDYEYTLCANRANNWAKLFHYSPFGPTITITDFRLSEIERAGLYVHPKDLREKLFKVRDPSGKLTIAGGLLGGAGGGLIGAVVGSLIADILPKEYKFNVILELKMKTKKKLRYEHLAHIQAYTAESEAAFVESLRFIVREVDKVIAFGRGNFADAFKPISFIW